MRLSGQAALITGGGTGIGRAIARAFAREGCDVAVNYSRSQSEAEETAAELRDLGVDAVAVHADVSRRDQVAGMLATVEERFQRLDLLVNNAGTTTFVPMHELQDLTGDHWDQVMAVNVKGAFFCVQAAEALLRAGDGGHVINIASTAGLTGSGSSIAYAASKAAMISLGRSLAQVLAPEVRVNTIAPGVVRTRWTAPHPDFQAAAAERTPMGRIAEPEDVAGVVLGIAADFTHFTTGQVVVVDGGLRPI